MLAGWIASGRIRNSPALIHSRAIASRSCCDGEHPRLAAARLPARGPVGSLGSCGCSLHGGE